MKTIRLTLPRPTLAWHQRLIEALRVDGHDVVISLGRAERIRVTAAVQLRAEKALHRCNRSLARASIPLEPSSKESDLTIVLDGTRGVGAVLVPFFDDEPGLDGIIDAICKGRAPLITIRQNSETIAAGRPALRSAYVLSSSIDDVLQRLIYLLVGAIKGTRFVVNSETPTTACPRLLQHSPGMLVRTFSKAVGNRLIPSKQHWRVGMRAPDRTGALTVIPDDGKRFYADPFAIHRSGTDYIFVEDYPYATKRGVISVIERTASGYSTAITALERPYHLSYPFIYAEGDDIFMIPETGSVRRVERYRAERFPDRWVLDRTLIEGAGIVDATIIKHEGVHWMFGAMAEAASSSWDCLMLYHAETLDGPWHAHAANPVVIDAGTARPAGHMWHDEGGMLMRVAQDCRGGYGQGVVTLRVDELTPTTYRQSISRKLEAPVGRNVIGFHTSNPAGDAEIIDFCELRWG